MKRISYFFMLPLLGVMLAGSIPARMMLGPTIECIVLQCVADTALENAHVALFFQSSSDTISSGYTDSDGSFIFNDLTVGDYEIHVSKSGYTSIIHYINVANENGHYIPVVCLNIGSPEL